MRIYKKRIKWTSKLNLPIVITLTTVLGSFIHMGVNNYYDNLTKIELQNERHKYDIEMQQAKHTHELDLKKLEQINTVEMKNRDKKEIAYYKLSGQLGQYSMVKGSVETCKEQNYRNSQQQAVIISRTFLTGSNVDIEFAKLLSSISSAAISSSTDVINYMMTIVSIESQYLNMFNSFTTTMTKISNCLPKRVHVTPESITVEAKDINNDRLATIVAGLGNNFYDMYFLSSMMYSVARNLMKEELTIDYERNKEIDKKFRSIDLVQNEFKILNKANNNLSVYLNNFYATKCK